MSRFLTQSKLSPRIIRDKALSEIPLSPHGFVLFDDTVIDKDFSRKIAMARTQYSGNAPSIVRGTGVVTGAYYNPDIDQFYALDYRIFDPDRAGLSKLDHIRAMLEGLELRNVP